MKFKVLVCFAALSLSVAACRKGPEASATNAATPQGSGTPATAGTPAPGAAAGQPGQPATPPAPPKPVPAQLPDVVARVNGENVTKADFERMLKTIESRAGQPIPADRRDEIVRGALDQLITYTLLAQESKTRGIKIDDTEIEAKMAELKKQFPTQEAFDKALKERGMTLDSLRHDARVDLSVNKLMETEVSTVPGPSDADAKGFYDKNPNNFQEQESVRASHILIRVDEKADAATKQKARAEIESVLKQVKAGGDFAKLAQEHSQDGSAAQGGDLNYFLKGQMVPAFDKVAFELKPGQVSDIVTTQFGYHIIKVTDHKQGRTVPYEEAQGKIKEFLTGQKKQEHADAFIEGLKKKSKIEVLI
jgi:peptidyl-prolyl cis-trans isomerase C